MARWNSCNILHLAPEAARLWRFAAKGGNFVLDREQKIAGGEPLPARQVAKSWSSLWSPRLNVAWLPPECVFLRVIELPKTPLAETLAMVELQLEKLSPLPVAQVVWMLHALPSSAADLQSVIVVIAERKAVEEFLGRLEGQGYLPDRLEAPMLDELEANAAGGDGAWIYAGVRGQYSALVAWRTGGSLRNLSLVLLPPEGDRVKSLKGQLAQLVWAGEMEGWLAGPAGTPEGGSAPRVDWHLVADPSIAGDWEQLLRAAVDEPVRTIPPLPPAQLAAQTARRAAAATGATLLPPEFTTRCHQQFVDRLWLRGLVTTGIVYAICVAGYFAATRVLEYKTTQVEGQVAALADSYTNVLELKARYTLLQQRQQLKYAALDCWKIAAENLPAGLTLQRSSFSGQTLTLNGACSEDQLPLISDPGKFYDVVRQAKLNDQNMFEAVAPEPLIWNRSGNSVNWRFTLQLKNAEAAKR